MWYRVQWPYRGALGVVLEAGATVQVSAAWAAAINADSPGVLLAVADYVATPNDEPFERIPADRMMRKPGRKRAVV